MTSSDAKKPLPPYLPYKTFDNALSSWQGGRLPGRIDRTVLGSYAGTMQSWVLSALRYFQLIDPDGKPTKALEILVNSEGQEREYCLHELIRHGYGFVFTGGFDLSKATPGQLREQFETTDAQGETLVKAISFFTFLAKAAGMELSPHLKTRQRRSNGAKRRVVRSVPQTVESPSPVVSAIQPSAFQVLYEILNVESMDEKEQQAVWTLLRYLKKKEVLND